MGSTISETEGHGAPDTPLRFDDMLATVLAQPMEHPEARVIAWRQVVDLIGQRRSAGDDPVRDAGLDLLHAARAQVPGAMRAEAARSIAGRRLPAELIAFFAGDIPTIAATVLAGARLTDDEWLTLLPTFSPTARGVLRNRRDLGTAVVRGLAAFGAHDLVLPGPASPPAPLAPGDVPDPASPVPTAPPSGSGPPHSAPGPSRVRDLLARIEALRRIEPAEGGIAADAGSLSVVEPAAGRFRFETGADGVMLWVEGAPRGPLIGLTIAAAAEPFEPGVDGQVAGAFRQRARFRDARLSIGGAGAMSGAWRISAVPFFDPVDGRFIGYRGSARRPRPNETANAATWSAGLYGTVLPADSLRQLVHELRTPLNAIVGFAEMMEREMLGPAARVYRGQAADIAGHGRRLLATVDDLDVSARLETQPAPLASGPVDAARLLAGLRSECDRVARSAGVMLRFAMTDEPLLVDADPAAVERMFARLLAATVGLAESGETIDIRLGVSDESDACLVTLGVTRPQVLAARSEATLLDPGYSPDGDWPDAPVLGLGFALRLIRNLALAAGGTLEIGEGAFVLRLPARLGSQLTTGHGPC